jgi:hypothetical protein
MHPHFEEASFVHNQHSLWFTQMLDDIVAKVIAGGICVPLCPMSKILQAIRILITSGLG